MAAKGSIAKDNLIKRFATAVGADYLGTDDGKKFYFISTENGEKVQVAITMTVPKTPFAGAPVDNGELNFEDTPRVMKEMDESEAAVLARLKEELGL